MPYGGQADVYRAIAPHVEAGQIVLGATSPLATAVGGRAWQVVRPWHGSAAEQGKALLPDGVRIVAGLHTIAADSLQRLDEPIESHSSVAPGGRADECQRHAVNRRRASIGDFFRVKHCQATSRGAAAVCSRRLLVSLWVAIRHHPD